MGRKVDLTGKSFGRLAVIREDGYYPEEDGQRLGRRSAWLCLCECGSEKRVRGSSLTNGSTRSCGCLATESRQRNNHKKKKTECVICGTEIVYRASRAKKTCSLECFRAFRRVYIQRYAAETPENHLRRVFYNAKASAKMRGLPFDITIEHTLKLLRKQGYACAKTGIGFQCSNNPPEKSPWAPSLDQTTPGGGYTENNIQLVCQMYNYCKHTWRHKDVLEFARAVATVH